MQPRSPKSGLFPLLATAFIWGWPNIIGMGNTLYYVAIKRVGTSISTNFLLSTPLVAGVLAYVILGERLTPLQMAFSAVLLTGCLLISRSAVSKKTQTIRAQQSAVGGK